MSADNNAKRIDHQTLLTLLNTKEKNLSGGLDFRNADLQWVDFTDANLRGARFDGANLTA